MDPTQTQPANPPKTSLMRVFALLAFALVIAVLSSLGTYWYISNKMTQQNQQQVSQQIPTVKQTENSQTYTDYGLGFSVSFPKDYTIAESKGASYSGIYGIVLEPISGQGYILHIYVGPGSDIVNQAVRANDPKVIFNNGPFKRSHVLTSNTDIQLMTLTNGQKIYQTQGFDTEYYKGEKVYATTEKNSIYEILVSKANTASNQNDMSKKIYQDIVGSFKIL